MSKKEGRPLLFNSPEELEAQINQYFDKCDEDKRPYTMSGLAYAMGIDRKTLVNYGHKEEFFPTIKRAREKCENYAEEYLFTGKNVAGVIFNLKNNYEWKDKTEQEMYGKDGESLSPKIYYPKMNDTTDLETPSSTDQGANN